LVEQSARLLDFPNDELPVHYRCDVQIANRTSVLVVEEIEARRKDESARRIHRELGQHENHGDETMLGVRGSRKTVESVTPRPLRRQRECGITATTLEPLFCIVDLVPLAIAT